MENNITAVKAFLTAIVAAGTAMWGLAGWLVILWIVCMVLDYITGSMAAKRNHEWSSSRAREGLWSKGGCATTVLVAALTDVVLGLLLNLDGLQLPFHYSALLTPVVLGWYILTELGSIAENAVKMGGKVPRWIAKGLKVAADALDKQGEQLVPQEASHDQQPQH